MKELNREKQNSHDLNNLLLSVVPALERIVSTCQKVGQLSILKHGKILCLGTRDIASNRPINQWFTLNDSGLFGIAHV